MFGRMCSHKSNQRQLMAILNGFKLFDKVTTNGYKLEKGFWTCSLVDLSK